MLTFIFSQAPSNFSTVHNSLPPRQFIEFSSSPTVSSNSPSPNSFFEFPSFLDGFIEFPSYSFNQIRPHSESYSICECSSHHVDFGTAVKHSICDTISDLDTYLSVAAAYIFSARRKATSSFDPFVGSLLNINLVSKYSDEVEC
jgi:hypothetical protein